MAIDRIEREDPSLALPFLIVHRSGPIPVVFQFPVRPQDVNVSHPARMTVHQTLGDNFLDDFSGSRAVLSQVDLRGTFGFSVRLGGIGVPVPGSIHLRIFETIYETFNALSRQTKTRIGAVQEYVNLGRLYLWRIAITHLEYKIQSRDPIVYYYHLRFLRLQDYLSPVDPFGGDFLPSLTNLTGRF